MRTTIASGAATLVLLAGLAGCGGSSTGTAASSTPTASSATPASSSAPATSATPTESWSSFSDLPAVPGYTVKAAPDSVTSAMSSVVSQNKYFDGFDVQGVGQGSQQTAIVLRFHVTGDLATTQEFENSFLPSFAASFAGGSNTGKTTTINGQQVVVVSKSGKTAYAWVDGSSVVWVLLGSDPAALQPLANAYVS